MPPMSIGLWLFYWAWTVLFNKVHAVEWYGWLAALSFMLVFTVVSLAVMSAPYGAMAALDWSLRLKFAKSQRPGQANVA
jgi:hypothetical protein